MHTDTEQPSHEHVVAVVAALVAHHDGVEVTS